MAQNKIVRFGPAALGAAAANLINPGTVAAGTGIVPAPAASYVIIKHLRVVNKSNAARTVTMYIGATGGSAAGTEFAFNASPVPADATPGSANYLDWNGSVRLDVADFLTGLSDSAASVTWQGEGEIGVA